MTTEAQRAEMLERRLAGQSIESIALEMGLSAPTVRRYTPRGIYSGNGKTGEAHKSRDGILGKRDVAVRRAVGGSRAAHRRRGANVMPGR